jgi:drug/metabolite transporter (DMT)-like permease
VVAAASLFALNASVTTVTLGAGVGAIDLTWWRCIGASVGLLCLLAGTQRERLRIRRAELPLLMFYGIVGVALVQLLYAIALTRLSVSLALLLEFTAPVLVALWARLVLKEVVRARVWAALVLSLAGLSLVAQIETGLRLDAVGLLAGLGASVSLAVYWLVGERAINPSEARRSDGGAHSRRAATEPAAQPRDALSLTFWGTTIGALAWFVLRPGSLPSIAGFGDATSLTGTLAGVRLPVGVLVAWICILGTLLPFVLDVAAFRHISATTVGLIGMLEPVGATLIAWAWLREDLTMFQAVGVGVVVLGIVLAQTARSGHTGAPVPIPTQADDGDPVKGARCRSG